MAVIPFFPATSHTLVQVDLDQPIRWLRRKNGAKRAGKTPNSKDRIMIFGPKNDATHVVEFRTAARGALAI
jgi:hypothetical protein